MLPHAYARWVSSGSTGRSQANPLGDDRVQAGLQIINLVHSILDILRLGQRRGWVRLGLGFGLGLGVGLVPMMGAGLGQWPCLGYGCRGCWCTVAVRAAGAWGLGWGWAGLLTELSNQAQG